MDEDNNDLFHVSVKALFFDDINRVMLIREPGGWWEIPGGRIKKGEAFKDALIRECREELGVDCQILDEAPYIIYPAIAPSGRGRIMIFFRVRFSNMNFKPTTEFEEYRFCTKEEVGQLKIVPQLTKLFELL